MSRNKKTADLAELNKKLDIAQQIIRNQQEDYGFVDILDKFIKREYVNTRPIVICKTPNVLVLGGANPHYDVVINPSTIVKCMSRPEEKYHGHYLDRDVFKYLVYELRNPVMLLKGSKDNTLVVVTDLKDRENRPIIITVALNRKNSRHSVNQITSAYGRNDFNLYLRRQVRYGNLIAVNKNKANQMFQSAGLRLPLEETLIGFDNSLAYSMENVKGFCKENSKNSVSLYDKPKIDNAIFSLSNLLTKFDKIISSNEEIIDMIRFFEYASKDIQSSKLWYQFQTDKPYLDSNNVISQLDNILNEAKKIYSKTFDLIEKFDDTYEFMF